MNKLQIVLLITVFSILSNTIKCAQPNPPTWPDSVKVFEPNDGATQGILDQVFATQGGHSPAFNGQFSSLRYALLFKPGTHNVNVNVGFYTQVLGMGVNPQDTNIQQVMVENGDFDFTGGALSNFWRSAENFYTKPTFSNAGQSNIMLWSVSQASPMRRVVIDGNLQLFEYNYGDAAGYASGGYMSDVTVSGGVYSGSQQQFITRNSKFTQWTGSVWNMVYVGTEGAPQQKCTDGPGHGDGIVNVGTTPLIAEKPYIVFTNGKYQLAVPPVETNKQGPSNYATESQMIDFEQVYVAKDTDSVDVINQQLAAGLHLVLTPGTYNLQDSIKVTKANTVVLGLGLATLVSATGKSCIEISNVDGVRVSGILLQAGFEQTDVLLQWGQGTYAGSATAPGILQDCYARVGGPTDPAAKQVTVDTMVQIDSSNVVIDNIWLWRADHGIAGETVNSQNPVKHGIIVNGDNVIAYGLAVEHTLEDLVQWNGNNGQVFFYQSELPYDVTQANFGDKKFISYRINESVDTHKAYGMGVYSFFATNNVVVDNGFVVPEKSGIQFTNLLTVFLNGNGEISHIINGQGDKAGEIGTIQYKCSWQGGAGDSFLSKTLIQ